LGGHPGRLGALVRDWLTAFRVEPVNQGQIVRAILVGVAIFLFAWLGIQLIHTTGRVACIWLANGLAAATLLRRPPGERAAMLSGGCAGNLLANLAAGDELVAAGLFAALNAFEIVTLVAVMGRRFAPDAEFDSAVVGRFLLVAVGAPLIPAAIAAA
jgi:integral membrane sensor domain MASE1